MLTKIAARHFRGFESLEIHPQAVTVLLGTNSCGKSTVLHAVRFGCSALSWALAHESVRPWKDPSGSIGVWNDRIREDEPFLPATRADELFLGRDTGGKIEIDLQFEDTDLIQQVQVHLAFGNNQALKMSVWVKSTDALSVTEGVPAKSKHLPGLLLKALQAGEPRAVFIPAFYGVIRREPYRSSAQIEQLLGEGEQGQIVRNLVSRLGTLKDLSDLLRGSVGAEILRCTSGQDLDVAAHLETLFRDTNGELELASSGTGLSALIALYASLKWYQARQTQGRPLTILLDEPEAHLHPRLQGETGARIADLVTGFGGQVLLATHSIEMVNRLGQRRDAVLLGIDRNANPAAVELTSERSRLDALDRFCDLLPLTPFASLQLLTSRRILFHEGPSDQNILEGCAKVYFTNDPVRLANFRLWTWAQLRGADNAGAKGVLKQAIAPLFPALQSGDVVRLVRVLDRDHHRVPQFGPAAADAKTHIEELDVVWSGHSIESLFIEPAALAAWIHPALGQGPEVPVEAELKKLIAEAIAAANQDSQLLQDAINQLVPIRLSALSVTQLKTSKAYIDALRDAEQTVKQAPEVWQRGHDRARFVLSWVRDGLPPSLRNKVRREIEQVITTWPGSALPSPALMPPEIRALLDHLVR